MNSFRFTLAEYDGSLLPYTITEDENLTTENTNYFTSKSEMGPDELPDHLKFLAESPCCVVNSNFFTLHFPGKKRAYEISITLPPTAAVFHFHFTDTYLIEYLRGALLQSSRYHFVINYTTAEHGFLEWHVKDRSYSLYTRGNAFSAEGKQALLLTELLWRVVNKVL